MWNIISHSRLFNHISNDTTLLHSSISSHHLLPCVMGRNLWPQTKPNQTVTKKFIRVIAYLKKYDHTNNAFSSLNILKLKEVSEYCSALFVYKSLANPYDHMFTLRNNPHYNLRQSSLLKLPAVQTLQSKSFIAFHGVGIWNNLPEDTRCAPSFPTFKRSLKKYLLSKYVQ